MHCWNPWTYKCSNHALPKYRDNRNGKWQIVKARLYFELGHKLRQTAAINYRVRHSSQVAYNSSRAIFDLFHMLWRWWTLSPLLRWTRDKFDNSFLLREEATEQSLLVRSRLFHQKETTEKAMKNIEMLFQHSALSLVPQPTCCWKSEGWGPSLLSPPPPSPIYVITSLHAKFDRLILRSRTKANKLQGSMSSIRQL